MINLQAFRDAIIKSQEENIFSLGNKVLYDMCKVNPKHLDRVSIVSKVWLIGRAYSASIERRKNRTDSSTGNSDDFYAENVADKMIEIGEELDNNIEFISNYDPTDERIIPRIIETHCFLASTYKEITNLNKRSLASKYLHFHMPNYFYIYDSRSKKNIKPFKIDNTELRDKLILKNADEEYLDFFTKAFLLSAEISKQLKIDLTPRELDNFLLKSYELEA